VTTSASPKTDSLRAALTGGALVTDPDVVHGYSRDRADLIPAMTAQIITISEPTRLQPFGRHQPHCQGHRNDSLGRTAIGRSGSFLSPSAVSIAERLPVQGMVGGGRPRELHLITAGDPVADTWPPARSCVTPREMRP